ncbi:MAG: iron-sulfur cluster co-chaperone HscB C-terminal domain-containing protein, partial [Planctomycetota bacterium]
PMIDIATRHPFARLDLPEADIEGAYLAQIARIHPDLAGGDAEDAMALAAQVNDARRTLADPLSRAEVLLARLGGATASEDKSLPPGFLMEIMELREGVEADRASGDPARLEARSREAITRRNEFVERLTPIFASAFGASKAPADTLAQIRTELNAWRYTERLIEQL